MELFMELQMTFLKFLQSIRTPFLDEFFSTVTRFGEEIVFMAVGMVVFWCINKFSGYYLLCGGFFGVIFNQFLKIIFRIPRPWVLDPSFQILENARAEGYSFPSGHTQSSVGLFGGVAKIANKKWLKILAVIPCILVPFSRMYLGVHTPLDVMASVVIALVIIFGFYPLFKKAEQNSKIMYATLGALALFTGFFLLFVTFYKFPAEVYTSENIGNLYSAQKNAYALFGGSLGILTVYFVDSNYVKFETKAVWWAQIIKVVVGMAIVIAFKELMRSPLEALFQHELIARFVRYYFIVIIGGVLWPMTFKFFGKLGKKKELN